MIEIMNLRYRKPCTEYDVRIDRTSVLGNPFRMLGEFDRDNVCTQYKVLIEQVVESGANADVLKELNRLKELYKKYGKLRLFCWCAPKRCHAETIRNFLMKD